ncbi:MAG: adenylate/guanylate cyclase domain-containing protein [Alphaproteobacteria bacterium]|nr:MAG: adenylate/guanylate cyclase domain-containing protein [Alphaproteobacteria bacterium]
MKKLAFFRHDVTMNYRRFFSWIGKAMPLCIVLGAAWVYISSPPMMTWMRNKIFDQYQTIEPRPYEPMPVTIIDVDEASLAKIGQWPWPRKYMAELQRHLVEAGAASIGYDIVFAEADHTSADSILPLWGDVIPMSEAMRSQLPNFDTQFAHALEGTPSVMGYVLDMTGRALQPVPYGFAYKGADPLRFAVPYSGAISSLPSLMKASQGHGALNAIPDDDGVIRKVPLVYRVGDKMVASLAAEILRVAQGASTYMVDAVETGITSVKIGAMTIPTDRHGHVWVHYTPYQASRYIPAWELFEAGFDKTRIEGHLILIGTSAAGLKDIRSTPLNPVTNGVEVHAQLLEQILLQHYLERPDWIDAVELCTLLVCGVLVWVITSFASPLWGALFALVVAASSLGVSWMAYSHDRLLTDPISPLAVVMMVYLWMIVRRTMRSEYERMQIRHAFSHYMSPALVEQLAKHPERLTLGGEMRPMTVLFCDIRGFTTLSEQFDAVGLTKFINSFLTPMTAEILNHQGTIDKYIGDCIMAFWNAPIDDDEHALHGCRAACAMVSAVAQLNMIRQKQSLEDGTRFLPVNIGVGLNSGVCCVGNMGSEQRFDYSVLGDSVNLASRLEGLSKYYGVTIIIGERTYQDVSMMACMELDCVMVKGKTEPTRIYALLGDEILREHYVWAILALTNSAMLDAYRTQHWDAAEHHLADLPRHAVALGFSLDDYAGLYRNRIEHYRAHPPAADWDGVYRATEK